MFVPHAANYLAVPHQSAFFASTARRSGLFKRFRFAASQVACEIGGHWLNSRPSFAGNLSRIAGQLALCR
jgi:hypothetical protein